MLLRSGRACNPESLQALFDGCSADSYGIPIPHPAQPFNLWLARVRADEKAGRSYFWAVEVPDRGLVGSVRLRHVDRALKTAQLSYWIAERERGRGYATGAGKLAVEFAFGTARLLSLDTWIELRNTASHLVARRLGFNPIGQAPSPRDALDAVVQYRLLASKRPQDGGADMLTIREEQLQVFQNLELRKISEGCLLETEQRYPLVIQRLTRERALRHAEDAALRASRYGFTDTARLRAFVHLALCVGPHFDRWPKIRTILTSRLDPADKLVQLHVDLTADDWEAAAHFVPDGLQEGSDGSGTNSKG